MNQTQQTNLFAMLSKYPPSKKSNPKENHFTQAICYFLSVSNNFKKVFLDILFEQTNYKPHKDPYAIKIYPQYAIKDNIQKEIFMNQNSLEEESIYVDPRTKIRYRYFDILLVHKSQEPEFCFVIENKIDAVPEIKQLVAYKKLIDINFKQYTNRSVILFDYESPLERANRLTKSKISNKEDKQWLMRNSIKSWKEERDRTFNFIEWDKLSKVLFKNSKQIQKDFPKEENNIFKQFLEYIWRDRQMGSDFRGMDTFDEINNPYSHEKAKGILRSLVNDKYLKDTYTKMDFKFRDRLTIWDRGVWDVIYQSPSHFTNKPHFGVSLQLGNIFTIDFTIPHQAPNAWKLLAELIKDNKLAAYLNEIRQNVPELWIRIDQRHSRGGQKLIEDAKIEFKWDLTMEKSISENNSFRVWPKLWLDLVKKTIEDKGPHNLQLELSVPYYINKDDPHRRYREGYNKYKISPDKADFPKEVARVMTVFKPLLKELMKQ